MGTEKAYIEQYRKNIDVFIGIEHGMKSEEAEQQFNKLAKSSLKKAVDDTRDTEGSTGQADMKHTSGGVCIAIDRWSLVVGGQQREGISGNGSRQRRKNCTSMAQCQKKGCRRLQPSSGFPKDGRRATKHESCETADKADAVSMTGSL